MIETGLKGKVVVVTGAAAGIGRTTALHFARQGCFVAAWDVKKTLSLVGEIVEAGGEGMFQFVDVTNPNAIEASLSRLEEEWESPHVLINNAGVLLDSQLVKFKDGEFVSEMSDEAWSKVIDVNLKGAFNCTRAFAKRMIPKRSGVILNAASVVGLYGNFGQSNYVASKAGIIGMTKVWARELGKHGIRVNAVAPGFIETNMVASMPEKILAFMKEHTPLGRLGKPDDIANAYVWLASDAASFVNGAVLSVDGGVVTGT
jgi:3-oxoacyl-[acyl-carrier protein] reductase